MQGLYKRHFLGVVYSLGQLERANVGDFRVVQKFSGSEDLVNSSSDGDKHRLKIKINSKQINGNRVNFIGIMSVSLKREKEMIREHRAMPRELGRKYIGGLQNTTKKDGDKKKDRTKRALQTARKIPSILS